jgi:hypothetical protein
MKAREKTLEELYRRKGMSKSLGKGRHECGHQTGAVRSSVKTLTSVKSTKSPKMRSVP